MKFVCKKSFQFRGSMKRPGQLVAVTPEDLKDPFIVAHVKNIDDEDYQPPRNYYGNGIEKKDTSRSLELPSEFDENIMKNIRRQLGKMGVQSPPNATKDELIQLYNETKEAFSKSQNDKDNSEGNEQE